MSKITYVKNHYIDDRNQMDYDAKITTPPVILNQEIPYEKKIGPVIKKITNRSLSLLESEYIKDAYIFKPPQIFKPLYLKTPTQTFNHTHEYVIKDNFLWFRRIGTTTFNPLFFDGYPTAKPIFIHADGANLFVMDEFYKHHYKKVLVEFRHDELDIEHREEIIKAGFNPDDYEYLLFDINEEFNWQDKWFSLPFLSSLVNIHKKRLTIPSSFKSLAISHRGRFNDYVDDHIGQHHPVNTGVTTLYVLDQNGQDIHKYDPWSPPWAKTIIGLKETATTSFVAHNISVSASTIMAIGFEINHQDQKKTLKILTRMADIDTEGANPGLKYSFTDDIKDKDTRVLPFDSDWQEHPLDLVGSSLVTEHITILQTGEGNNARVLRVAGKNQDDEWGYYQKQLTQKKWSFFPCDLDIPHHPLLALDDTPITTTVFDYEGSYSDYQIKLINWGERSNHAQLIITMDNNSYNLDIYKRFSFITFLGVEKYKYDLVNYNHDNDILKHLLGDHKTIEIKIKKKGDNIIIKLDKLGRHHINLKKITK